MKLGLSAAYKLVKSLDEKRNEPVLNHKTIDQTISEADEDLLEDINRFQNDVSVALQNLNSNGDSNLFEEKIVHLRMRALGIAAEFENFVDTLDKVLQDSKTRERSRPKSEKNRMNNVIRLKRFSDLEIIERNAEGEDDTLIGDLHERSFFDERYFWDLYNAILRLNRKLKTDVLDYDLIRNMFRIQRSFFSKFLFHYHPRDLYKIRNARNFNFHPYIERFDAVLSDFGRGELSDMWDDGLVNPEKLD